MPSRDRPTLPDSKRRMWSANVTKIVDHVVSMTKTRQEMKDLYRAVGEKLGLVDDTAQASSILAHMRNMCGENAALKDAIGAITRGHNASSSNCRSTHRRGSTSSIKKSASTSITKTRSFTSCFHLEKLEFLLFVCFVVRRLFATEISEETFRQQQQTRA